MTDREQLLVKLRPASFAIAYRMLDSGSGAGDVVHKEHLHLKSGIDRRILPDCGRNPRDKQSTPGEYIRGRTRKVDL
jgi:hypothetical protein